MLERICRLCMIHRQQLFSCIRVPRTSLLGGMSRRLLFGIRHTSNLARSVSRKPLNVRTQSNKHFEKHRRWVNSMSNDSSVKEYDLNDFYTLNYIYVRTSKERWHEAPEGLQFDAGYIDSMPDCRSSKVPVILGLPSSVGNHEDLMNLLLVFVKYGCRVIIPNMPSTKYCACGSRSETTIFTNTPDEKAEFVKDFLAELDVNKVRMLVTDSDSVYTGIMLCSQDFETFQSFAMINPTGLKHTRFMKPVIMYRNINVMWDETFYMQPLIWALLYVVKMFTSKRRLATDEFITLSKTIKHLDFNEIAAELEILSPAGIPLMALYREDCTELDKTSTEEMLDKLGIPESSISVYSDEDPSVKKGVKNGKNWGVLFEGDVGDIKETKLKTIRTKLFEFYKDTS